MIVLIIIGALFIAYLLLCQMVVRNDSIWSNTTVNGVALKGLTYDEAREAISRKFEEDYAEAELTIELDGNEFKIDVFPLLELNATEQIDKAYELGHESWIKSGIEWIWMKISGGGEEEIEVKPTVKSEEAIEQAVSDTGIFEYKSLVDTTWEVTEESLIVHKGQTGEIANKDQLMELVNEAFANLDFTQIIECPYTEEVPEAPNFQEIADSVHKEASNATLDPENGYAIVESVTGTTLDAQAASEAYGAAEEGTDVNIQFTLNEPEISTEDMQENLFADLLGTYYSVVSGDSGKRTNIRLASEAVSGVILMPGEEFSYNGLVGNTTPEKGYQTAAVYKDGKVEYESGGGVCQVSSTIFAAILYTDLEVTQRRCHSMVVTYVPYGMDATVYWDQPDFKFVNNHDYPIRVDVSFDGSVINVEIWGTQESDITVEPRVDQTGELSFATYREYYDADGNLIDTEYIGGSKYKPVS